MGFYQLFRTSVLRRTFLRERGDIALYGIVYTKTVFDKSGHRLAVAVLYTLCIIAVLRYRTVVILCSAVIFRYCAVKAFRFALKTLRIHSRKADELFLYILHYLRIVRAVEPLFRVGVIERFCVNIKYKLTQTAVVLYDIILNDGFFFVLVAVCVKVLKHIRQHIVFQCATRRFVYNRKSCGYIVGKVDILPEQRNAERADS